VFTTKPVKAQCEYAAAHTIEMLTSTCNRRQT